MNSVTFGSTQKFPWEGGGGGGVEWGRDFSKVLSSEAPPHGPNPYIYH